MRTVIVIEDDVAVRNVYVELLKLEGCSVQAFQNAREALDNLQSWNNPALIITDLHMPVMDGWEFLVSYKGTVPVYVVSSAGCEEDVITLGAKGYMPKPMDVGRFVSIVHQHCQQVI